MANEITELFGAVPHGVVVDATLGGAGHAMRLLTAYPWMSVFGIDQDPMAIEHARKVSPQFSGRLMFHQGRFDGVSEFLHLHHVSKISGALFDLGVSSPQFDEADRGFSYRNDGQLDMRMDTTQEFSALDVVNGYEVQQLADVLRDHADERFAFRIAKAIVAARPVMTTSALAEIVAKTLNDPSLDPAQAAARINWEIIHQRSVFQTNRGVTAELLSAIPFMRVGKAFPKGGMPSQYATNPPSFEAYLKEYLQIAGGSAP